MHNTRNIAQQCQDDIDPEMLGQPGLHEYANWRQDNGDDNANKIFHCAVLSYVALNAPYVMRDAEHAKYMILPSMLQIIALHAISKSEADVFFCMT